MRVISTTMTALVMAASLVALAPPSYAQSCQQLWVERNQYYKNHGYCFKTQRAISYFGNGGCRINDQNDLPLTSGERARINQIVQQERALGCSDGGGGGGGGRRRGRGNELQPALGGAQLDLQGARLLLQDPARHWIFRQRRLLYQNEGDIPFSSAERAQIAQIQAQERAKGCD